MKKIIFLLISIVFIAISCEDVFEKQPLDKISDAVVWNDAKLIDAYLLDVYSRMPYNNQLRNANLDTKTDIGTTNKGNQDALTQGQMSRTSEPFAFWNYALIRDVNIIISRIGEGTFPQFTKDRIEGEARVLRATLYFEMQKRYGGVPLVDVPLDPFNPIDEKYTKRSTEEVIADFIDADLARAITLLGENDKPIERINKWTAYAAKARANLWTASVAKYGTIQLNGLVGIPAARANEFYTKASAAANAVIQSGKYALYSQHADKSENYFQLFRTVQNGETILSKVYDGAQIACIWNQYNLPQSLSGARGGWDNPLYDYILACENIDGSPDQPLLGPDHLYDYGHQAFEQKDPRIKANVFFDGMTHAGFTIRTYEGIDPGPVPDPSAILNNPAQSYMGIPQVGDDSRLGSVDDKSTRSGFLIRKFLTDELFVRDSSNPWMEFRLGEMYLTRAEAEFELGNPEPAATALNATRARAGISLVDAGSITLQHVRTERMSEMFFEMQRWWDLRRWRIAENVLNNRTMQGLRPILHYQTGKIYYLPLNAEPFSRTFQPHQYYNPITDARINNNVNLVENPGY